MFGGQLNENIPQLKDVIPGHRLRKPKEKPFARDERRKVFAFIVQYRMQLRSRFSNACKQIVGPVATTPVKPCDVKVGHERPDQPNDARKTPPRVCPRVFGASKHVIHDCHVIVEPLQVGIPLVDRGVHCEKGFNVRRVLSDPWDLWKGSWQIALNDVQYVGGYIAPVLHILCKQFAFARYHVGIPHQGAAPYCLTLLHISYAAGTLYSSIHIGLQIANPFFNENELL